MRHPERTFSLFTWLNNGGLVMDWLIAGIEDTDPDAERVATAFVSIAALAERLKLSRTHLARKLGDAEALGSIGWQGKRGQSVMWVSAGFRREYRARRRRSSSRSSTPRSLFASARRRARRCRQCRGCCFPWLSPRAKRGAFRERRRRR